MFFFKKYFSGYNKPGGIKELWVIALPMIISSASDVIMTFTDRLFLARIGPEYMNAALGGGIAMQVLTFFFVGLLGYSTALVAQYFGAGEKSNASKTLFQAILICIIAWPIILLLKPIVIKGFYLLNIPKSQIGYQILYLNILAYGAIFSLFRNSISSYFSGIGRTMIIMKASIFAMLVNVVLDYIFIFGKFGLRPMGIEGAAIASVCGAFTAVVILVFAYLKKTNRLEFLVLKSFRFDWKIMRTLIHYGYPAGLELFLNLLGFSIITSIFHSQGDIIATATSVMFNWDLVAFIPLLGVEIAVTSLVGRYMGAGRPQVAHRAALSGIKSGLFYSFVILLLFVLIPDLLVHLFRPDEYSDIFEKSVPLAIKMIKLASLYVLADAIMIALVGALRGAGDTHFTMYVSVLSHWSLIPILYLTLNVFKLSVIFSWFLLILVFLILCTILIVRFRKGKWKQIKMIEK